MAWTRSPSSLSSSPSPFPLLKPMPAKPACAHGLFMVLQNFHLGFPIHPSLYTLYLPPLSPLEPPNSSQLFRLFLIMFFLLGDTRHGKKRKSMELCERDHTFGDGDHPWWSSLHRSVRRSIPWWSMSAAKADPGLWLCTESCEMAAEEAEMDVGMSEAVEAAAEWEGRRRSGRRRTERKQFPPPLRWLQGRGRGFMRAERRDGRLILTEVRIERHEFFRASREDQVASGPFGLLSWAGRRGGRGGGLEEVQRGGDGER